MTTYLRPLGIALLLALAWATNTAGAEEGPQKPPPSHAFLDMLGTVSPVGDIEIALSMRPAPERWKVLKYRYTTPQVLLRDLLSHHSEMQTEFPAPVKFDERNLRIHTTVILRGYARNEGDGEWSVDLDPDEGQTVKAFQSAEAEGRTTLTWVLEQEGDGVVFEITMGVTLPQGARDVRADEEAGTFRYRLSHPTGEGRPRLDTAVEVKPRILTGAYKVYGLGDAAPQWWLAKAVLKNTGPSVIRRLRVRLQVQGYSEWGLWSKFPEVVPGQTVVVPYYPVLDAKVAQLQSKTPANVMMEWRYEDKDGKEYDDSDGQRATLMGGHEFYFTNLRAGEMAEGNFYEVMTENSDVLVAWVSREDAVVDQFAAMANRLAGGAQAAYYAEAAMATLHGIYELWVRNDFVYLSPPGIKDTSVSFDPKMVQNIKYPRDVIRDKAGTCIDLAILYCAMSASQGLESYLALVPGHCFPVFLLPPEKGKTERHWQAIEATGIMGGLGPRVATWAEVLERGQEQLGKVFRGEMPGTLVPVAELWQRGLSGPELPDLPADILQRWGISEGTGPIRTAGGGQPEAGAEEEEPEPQAEPTAPQGGSGILGRWVGQQVYQTPNGNVPATLNIIVGRTPDGGLAFEAASQIHFSTPDGTLRMASTAAGRVVVDGSLVTFHIQQGMTRNLDTGETQQDAPSIVTLTLRGDTITGTSESDEGITVQFALRRQ